MDSVGYVCDITEDVDGDGYPDYVDNNDDCDDDDDGSYYVGAAYMESDLDGDGMDDCSTDADGDGYALEGTDCDDEDESTHLSRARTMKHHLLMRNVSLMSMVMDTHLVS